MSYLLSLARKAVPLSIKKKVHKLRNLIPKKVAQDWTLKSGIRIKVASSSDWVIYNDIFVDQEYDLPILKTLRSAPSDRSLYVLDIGANVGFFTLRFLHLLRQRESLPFNPQITLVEGSPTVASELRERLLFENNLVAQVRIVHGLVGERFGSARISKNDFHAANSMFFDKTADYVNVNFVNLDMLFEADDVIDLLKCDIEGAELLFVENYPELLRRCSRLVFELHHDRCDTQKCARILADLGFINQTTLRETPTFSVCHFSK